MLGSLCKAIGLGLYFQVLYSCKHKRRVVVAINLGQILTRARAHVKRVEGVFSRKIHLDNYIIENRKGILKLKCESYFTHEGQQNSK